MSRLILPMLLAATLVACAQTPSEPIPYPTQSFAKGDVSQRKPVRITMIHHGSIALEYDGFQIQVDPVSKMGGTQIDYSCFPKADVILVTHEHGDHFDPEAIEALSKDGTRVILNPATQQKLGYGEAIANGEFRKVGPVGITAVPAYNISEGRQNFHPKGNGNGYILDFDGFKVYVAGDTEDIDEMASIGPVDVAFLPVNQPYTMTTTQCIEAAMTLKPKVLIPYHMSQTEIQEVKTVLDANDSGIEVLIFEELR